MTPPEFSKVSRQQVVGSATRAETRRRLLAAAGEEFAQRGYAASTVERIARRAGVTVQTLYLAWGSKRALLHGYLESVLTDSAGPPEGIVEHFAGLAAPDVVHQLAVTIGQVAERSATAWKLYRDAAGADPEIAADWQELHGLRRVTVRRIVELIPAEALRGGLTLDTAADTVWVIVSPEAYDLLVRTAGYSIEQYVEWLATTLRAALVE